MAKSDFYTDLIEDLDLYGVFHTETSTCYATFCSEEEAEKYLEEM